MKPPIDEPPASDKVPDEVPAAIPAQLPSEIPVSLREITTYFAKLGWLAFGGPVGQIGLMHLECVERRGWISEEEFLRALNFTHILPGPEATQLAIYIGYKKGGYLAGALAGFLFILPGYLTLCALAWIYVHHGKQQAVLAVLWGFRPVAVALLAAALLRIGRAAFKSQIQVVLAMAAFIAFFVLQLHFIPVLLGAGAIHVLTKRAQAARAAMMGISLTALFAPSQARALGPVAARLADISWFFLKTGLVSFGGAYAVLPFLREGAVGQHHWLTDPQMMDALALGETTPGPLISIGIFIGYLAGQGTGTPLWGATCAAFWLFIPSFVFVLAAAPYLAPLSRRPAIKEFLQGVTAGVVGLMLSVSLVLARIAILGSDEAAHHPIDWITVVMGVCAFVVLTRWKWRLNVVVVVLAGGVLGLVRASLPGWFPPLG